jgi:small redox-active disulfide protein 2
MGGWGRELEGGGRGLRSLAPSLKTRHRRDDMKKVQVLGPGCPKCVELAKRAQEAAQAVGGDIQVEKITELNKIMSFGVFMTPALVVDGEVMVVGKVPSVDEIKKMIT